MDPNTTQQVSTPLDPLVQDSSLQSSEHANNQVKVRKIRPGLGAAYRWKKGKSGNPKGRPRKRPMSEAADNFAQTPLPAAVRQKLNSITVSGARINYLKPGATWADAMILSLGSQAMKGNVNAIKEFGDRIEGKSPHRVEIINPQDRAKMQVNVVLQQTAITNPEALNSGAEFAAKLAMETAVENEKNAIIAAVVSSPEGSEE